MKIVTLTLNPAFDLHCSMQALAVGHAVTGQKSYFQLSSLHGEGLGGDGMPLPIYSNRLAAKPRYQKKALLSQCFFLR